MHRHPYFDEVPVHPKRLLPVLLALGLSAVACDDDATPSGPVAPMVAIASPASGTVVSDGTTIRLTGSATDPQDGALDASGLVWSSSIDGDLGPGSPLDVTPSVGVHTITLTATDADGNEGSASVSVSVEALDFLDGTVEDPQIGLVVNTLSNAVRMFQLGDPGNRRDIPLGASSAVTATALAVRGERAVVPLGNAASVAVIDLRAGQPEGFYLFDSGNATGADFADDETVVVANQTTNQAGRFTLGQAGTAIADLVDVAPFPNDVIAVSPTRVLVVSSNLDENFLPIGDGVVTAIDPTDMTVIGSVGTGGQNAQLGALGPDGLLYVPNAGDFVSPATVGVIDPSTLTLLEVIDGFAAGSGGIHVDGEGLVYVSAFFNGTTVWDSGARTFVRGPENPVCAPLEGGGCRGAFSATTAADGSVYQTFFGSPSEGLSPWIFRYAPGSFALTDSIASGLGPVSIDVEAFREDP